MSNGSMRVKSCAQFVTAAALVTVFSLSSGVGLYAQGSKANMRTGTYRGKPIQFEVINGWAVMQATFKPRTLRSRSRVFGTGFTANTQVCFLPPNGAGPCLPITYQTPNLIQVQVSQQDVLATA